MKRAGVFIGVNRTGGGLPVLKAAASGARSVHEWAQKQQQIDPAQKIDPAILLTDESGGRVTPTQIFDAIFNIVEPRLFDQLIVYFAGHGIQNRFDEYWLLSDAPINPNAAVSRAGSTFLAQSCGFKHVVMIADCCRTPAGKAVMERISGSEIFPNFPTGNSDETPVDTFFATTSGSSAFEAPKPGSPDKFVSIYTEAFLDALNGRIPNLADVQGCVYPRSVKNVLSDHITKHVIPSLGLPRTIFQVPTANVVSEPPDTWLTCLKRVSPGPLGRYGADDGPVRVKARSTSSYSVPGDRRSNRGPMHPPKPDPPEIGLDSITQNLVRLALSGDGAGLAKALSEASVLGYTDLADTVAFAAKPFGPTHHETGCGIKVRGARIVKAWSRSALCEIVGAAGDDVRILPGPDPGNAVLLELDQGTGIVVPVLPEFFTSLTLDNGELIDITYEPVEGSSRWPAFKAEEPTVRALQATASASTRNRVFKLDETEATKTAELMQHLEGSTPMLGIYAAYAYDARQRRRHLVEMSKYMAEDLGGCFFDIALLAGILGRESKKPQYRIFSPFPMLAQGWASMRPRRVFLPASLEDFQDTLVPSLWTMFNRTGIALCRRALDKGDLQ